MWKIDPSERVARWRAFRLSLGGLPIEKAIQAVAEFWRDCPYNAYYLDPADPDSWPTAWDLVAENYYCDIAKALGMLYTVAYSRHRQMPMELCVYSDPETGYVYNLSVFDKGKYVINFLDAEIVNIQQVKNKLVLKRRYSSTELKLQ
jgi:hypothetical protein